MFNLQSFSSQKSLVADGNIAVALNRIRSLLTKLLHSPETGVIYLTSIDAVTITKGMIVSLGTTNPYTCFRSFAQDVIGQPYTVRGIAICLSNSIATGEGGYFRIAGEALVTLDTGLTPVEGDSVYVSPIAEGLGNNNQPSGTDWIRQVGIIKDTNGYDNYVPGKDKVKIIIEKCCEYQLAQ